jgi:hypothetical protein
VIVFVVFVVDFPSSSSVLLVVGLQAWKAAIFMIAASRKMISISRFNPTQHDS